MCGIAGKITWDQPADSSLVQAMTRSIRHRGPDAEGLFVDGPAALGHRRLAVLDTSALANQPMSDSSGRYVIVFNGEIYNFRDIRTELVEAGVNFRSRGDTEVVLEGFRLWGVDIFRRLNGMFALALWDSIDRRLVLARDRLGKKPLFWAQLPGNQVVFASEIKALAIDPAIDDRISDVALGQFLTLGYVLSSAAVYAGVDKLPPAHFAIFECGRLPRVTSYWNLAERFLDKSDVHSLGEAAEQVRELVDDSVRLRMVSDVPLGAFLSGGLDSSTVVGAMCRMAGADLVRTFTMGFDEPRFDERPEAAAAAAFFGCRHLAGTAGADSFGLLERIAWHADEPFADTSIIPTFLLSEFARRDVTVVLTGDGGDELFSGYETYVADRLRHWTRWLPTSFMNMAATAAGMLPTSHGKVALDFKARQFFAGCRQDADGAHFSWRTLFSPEGLRRLLPPEQQAAALAANPCADFRMFAAQVKDAHYLDRAMYVDIKTWLVDDILVKVDRATMAHGLEARAPLLDYRLVELAASLPVTIRMPGLEKKRVLRASQRGRVSPAVLTQRKAGFNAPVNRWLAMADPRALARELAGDCFNEDEIARLVAEHRSRGADHGFRLFALKMWQMWVATAGKPAPVAA